MEMGKSSKRFKLFNKKKKSTYLHKICTSQYRKLRYLKRRYDIPQKILDKNEDKIFQ